MSLKQYLLNRGCEIVGEIEAADVICSLDVPVNYWGFTMIPKAAKTRGLLVIQEPPVVRPRNASQRASSRFADTISVGRLAQGVATLWPVVGTHPVSSFFDREKLRKACLVASDNLSFVQGELYSLRRQVLQDSECIDLYGRGWNGPASEKMKKVLFELWSAATSGLGWSKGALNGYFSKQKRYHGAIDHKEGVVSRYKVSIVIENDASYVSEKLLEAVMSGSIPVYVGPDLEKYGVPRELFVSAEPDSKSVLRGVDKALTMNFEAWKISSQHWLKSIDSSGAWSPEALWGQIHDRLSTIHQGPMP